MKKLIIGLVALGILLVASGRAIVRPASAVQSTCPTLCSTPAQYTCSMLNVLDFPSIPAHSTAEIDITVTGAGSHDEVIVTPAGLPEAGLMWGAFSNNVDIVTIRLANVTDSAIDPFPRRCRITVNHYQ